MQAGCGLTFADGWEIPNLFWIDDTQWMSTGFLSLTFCLVCFYSFREDRQRLFWRIVVFELTQRYRNCLDLSKLPFVITSLLSGSEPYGIFCSSLSNFFSEKIVVWHCAGLIVTIKYITVQSPSLAQSSRQDTRTNCLGPNYSYRIPL